MGMIAARFDGPVTWDIILGNADYDASLGHFLDVKKNQMLVPRVYRIGVQ